MLLSLVRSAFMQRWNIAPWCTASKPYLVLLCSLLIYFEVAYLYCRSFMELLLLVKQLCASNFQVIPHEMSTFMFLQCECCIQISANGCSDCPNTLGKDDIIFTEKQFIVYLPLYQKAFSKWEMSREWHALQDYKCCIKRIRKGNTKMDVSI